MRRADAGVSHHKQSRVALLAQLLLHGAPQREVRFAKPQFFISLQPKPMRVLFSEEPCTEQSAFGAFLQHHLQ